MLKGVAKAGDGDSREDHLGMVVALSNLSKTLSGPEANSTFAAAAQAGATMLRTDRMMVFVKDDAGGLAVAACTGVTNRESGVVDAAREVVKAALSSSGPICLPRRLVLQPRGRSKAGGVRYDFGAGRADASG